MNLKHKSKPIFFLLFFVVGTFLATISPILQSRVEAADTVNPYNCTFTFADTAKKQIKRSGCNNGIGEAIYKSVESGNQFAHWELKEGDCQSAIIQFYESNDPELAGDVKTSKGCEGVPTGGVITIGAGATDPALIDAAKVKAAWFETLNNKLQPLIDEHCASESASSSGGAPTYCRESYSNAIFGCVEKLFTKFYNKFESGDQDANKKFADQFTDCLIAALPAAKPKLKKNEILLLLGDVPLDELITAGAVATGSEEVDGTPSCENSAGPAGWLICLLIDGLQSLVGGMYDNIIKPLLITDPLSTENSATNGTYKAWKNFRAYGDVLLVIALLVIVFGESIGGGLIDAYTAKKVLPRLLIAAVLINLSFYVVAVLVDLMNIVGNGLMALITAPFGLTGDFTLDIGVGGATSMTGLLGAALVYTAVSTSGQFFSWLIFTILLPLALVMLAILATVLIRRALIVFLVIISPVAFALYCLPNTEKYFRQWWDILFKTLLVYPIIAALFAMGKVSGYLLSRAGGNVLTGAVGDMMAVVALVVPLLLIPFSFKIAGGVMATALGAVEGMRGRGQKFTEGTRQRIATQGGKNRIQSRQKYYNSLQDQASKGGAVRRNTIGRGLKGINKVVGGYNIEAASSAARADTTKILNDQIATGKDEEIRGLTVNKRTSRVRTDASGKRQFESLGGAWIDEADVDAGHARWGNDTYAQQAALSYEMRKAQDEGQLQRLGENYKSVAQGPGGWNMNDQQAGGAWMGAAFERQNEHLEYKGTDWETGKLKVDKKTGIAGASFVEETYQKKGSYPLAQMGSNTIEQLKEAHNSASTVLATSADPAARAAAQQQMDKIKAISETFMNDMPSTIPGTTAGGPPAAVLPGSPAPGGPRRANTAGAASVAERVYELANLTGAYAAAPANPTGPGSPQS